VHGWLADLLAGWRPGWRAGEKKAPIYQQTNIGKLENPKIPTDQHVNIGRFVSVMFALFLSPWDASRTYRSWVIYWHDS
jgi:hypothetical protein